MPQVGEDLHPELRALVVLEPHAEHLALAVHPDRQRQITSASLHAPAVADLQDHAVQEHHRVDVLERPALPSASVVHDRIGDPANQVTSHFDAVDLGQVRFDIPRRKAPGVEGEDLLVEPLKTPLTLLDDLRLEATITIPRGVDLHRPVLGHQRLWRTPIASVARAAGRLEMRLIPQMVSELDLHRSLDQPLRQLRKQPTRPHDLLLPVGTGEQLVHHLVRKQLPELSRQLAHPRRSTSISPAGIPLRSPSGLAPRNASGNLVLRLHLRRCRHESPFDSVPTQFIGHSHAPAGIVLGCRLMCACAAAGTRNAPPTSSAASFLDLMFVCSSWFQ